MGSLAGSCGMDPMPDRKRAGDQAQRDEDHHAPDERWRFGDAQDGGAKLDGQHAEDAKANGAAHEIDGGHAPQGIAQGTGGGNDHGEGKGWRREASDGDGNSRAIADSLLQLVELFLTGYLPYAIFSEFASHLGKQDHPNG